MVSHTLGLLPFHFQVLDDQNLRRRFRASNHHSKTQVNSFMCTMPISVDDRWNQFQFNLADITRRAYGTSYVETQRVQVCVCVRIAEESGHKIAKERTKSNRNRNDPKQGQVASNCCHLANILTVIQVYKTVNWWQY